MPVPNYFDYCNFVVCFEIGKYGSSNLFFFKIILTVWGPLTFSMNFRVYFSVSAKNIVGILVGNALSLRIALGSIVILTMFSSDHEQGMMGCLSIYLCFSAVLSFSLYKSFASLVKFKPKYYFFFDAFVNGSVFLIFFFKLFIVNV